MARPRQRVCLDDGLKLDANKLVRDTFWPTGSDPLVFSTQWTSSRDGVIASANMVLQQHGEDRAVLRIFFRGKFKQRIELVAQPRHFGGNQWYFKCPATGRKCSVVWQPPGTSRFCSRQAWGKQVAYSTQFQTPFVRAVMAREKVKDRLIGDLNLRQWDLPPKAKWMRTKTYERLAAKYLSQQDKIDQIIADYVR